MLQTKSTCGSSEIRLQKVSRMEEEDHTQIEALAAAIAFLSFLFLIWSNLRSLMLCSVKGMRLFPGIATQLAGLASFVVDQGDRAVVDLADLDWPVGEALHLVVVNILHSNT